MNTATVLDLIASREATAGAALDELREQQAELAAIESLAGDLRRKSIAVPDDANLTNLIDALREAAASSPDVAAAGSHPPCGRAQDSPASVGRPAPER